MRAARTLPGISMPAHLALSLGLSLLAAQASAQQGLVLATDVLPEGAPFVIVARDGTTSVITAAPAAGEPLVLALPAPTEAPLAIVDRGVVRSIDEMTAPRWVGYVEMDPCESGVGPEEVMHLSPLRDRAPELAALRTAPMRPGLVADLEGPAVLPDADAVRVWLATHGASAQVERFTPAEGAVGYLVAPSTIEGAVRVVVRSERFVAPSGSALGGPGGNDPIVFVLGRFRRWRDARSDVHLPTDVAAPGVALADPFAAHRAALATARAAAPAVSITEAARSVLPCPSCTDDDREAMLATLGLDVLAPAGFLRSSVDTRAVIGAIEVAGPLPSDEARRVIHRVRSIVQYCYERTIVVLPSVAGRLTLVLSVSASGAVESVAFEHDGSDPLFPPPLLTHRLERAARNLTFAAADGPSTVRVSVRFGAPRPGGTTQAADWIVSRLRAPGGGALIELALGDPLREGNELELAVAPELRDASDAFVTRYVTRQPFPGEIACDDPIRERWVDPPSREALALAPEPSPAPPSSAPEASRPAAAPTSAPPSSCACRARTGAASPAFAALAWLVLALLRLNRARAIG